MEWTEVAMRAINVILILGIIVLVVKVIIALLIISK